MKAERISPDSSSDRVERVIQRGNLPILETSSLEGVNFPKKANFFSSLRTTTGTSPLSIAPGSPAGLSQDLASSTAKPD